MVRIKHRYLLVHILSPINSDAKSKTVVTPAVATPPDVVQFHSPIPNDLTPQLLIRDLKNQVQYLYGDYGLGLVASSLVVKYLSPATATAIIRCARSHYRLVWAALTFMTQLPKSPSQKQIRPCVMQVVRVSGTIKKAEEEAIKRARSAILKAKRESGDDGVDGLMGFLGEEEENVGMGKEKVIEGSDVSDEEDVMAMDTDEDN